MSAFSSFLNPGNTPSTPAANPLTSTSTTTPATQPSTSTAQPISSNNAFTTSAFPSSSSAATGASAATLRLRDIAQQSQKLNETIRAGSAELPKLELSLGMIREKARDMSRRAGGAGRENMQQAYFSLQPCLIAVTFFSRRQG